MSINRVVVSGNLTRDPELRMAGQTPVLSMGIAVNDRRKNNETGQWEDVPNFFDVDMWGTRGESLSRFLSKGMKVVVSGRLRWRQWETEQGAKQSKVSIVADDVEFMNPRSSGGSGGSGSAHYSAPASPAPSAEVLDADIPF